MGFWGWVFLFMGVCFAIGIVKAMAESQKHNEQGQALSVLPDFTPAVVFKGAAGGAGIAIDAIGNKFAISSGSLNTKIFKFSDLIAVEVLRNGSAITKTNRGSQVAGAAVGALLLGPVGLLLGGVSGSKRSIEKVDRLSLKIFTNDLMTPVHEIIFFNTPGTKPESILVKSASQELDAWHGRLQTILHMSAQSA